MSERLLVCGGRDYANRAYLFRVLDAAHASTPVEVLIHGAAKGADSMAGEWAVEREVPVFACPADWRRHGAKAGPIRNQQMLFYKPTLVIAFPGGKGTEHMGRLAERLGVDVRWIAGEGRDFENW